MQNNAISRWIAPLMAFCLSFIIIATLAPVTGISVERQIDFWLLWLGTMVILALPICYLEIALAKRSKTTALEALSSLTRDADASQRWRLAGWLAVVFIPFLAGGMLSNASQLLTQVTVTDLASNIVFIGLAVSALFISFVPRKIIVLLTAIAVITSLVLANTLGAPLAEWQVTPLEFGEWGNATILALVASGLGMGIYWQSSLAVVKTEDVATKTALPIWFAQLLAVVAFGFFAAQTQIPAFVLVFAVVTSAALLLQLAREQLGQRSIHMALQWLILVLATFLWVIPTISPIFNTILVVWGLVICFVYALFVGWVMKISHLRKALNFRNEAVYNIWRIAIRIILPLSIMLALMSYLGQLV